MRSPYRSWTSQATGFHAFAMRANTLRTVSSKSCSNSSYEFLWLLSVTRKHFRTTGCVEGDDASWDGLS